MRTILLVCKPGHRSRVGFPRTVIEVVTDGGARRVTRRSTDFTCEYVVEIVNDAISFEGVAA